MPGVAGRPGGGRRGGGAQALGGRARALAGRLGPPARLGCIVAPPHAAVAPPPAAAGRRVGVGAGRGGDGVRPGRAGRGARPRALLLGGGPVPACRGCAWQGAARGGGPRAAAAVMSPAGRVRESKPSRPAGGAPGVGVCWAALGGGRVSFLSAARPARRVRSGPSPRPADVTASQPAGRLRAHSGRLTGRPAGRVSRPACDKPLRCGPGWPVAGGPAGRPECGAARLDGRG